MASLGERLTIGAVSRRTRVNIETIRYYERVGVLPRPPRSAGGYRLYSTNDARRLAFVRRARELGFSLDGVRALLSLADRKIGSCSRAQRMGQAHLDETRRKIADLRLMETVLARLVAECADGMLPACPLVETLMHQADAAIS